MSLMSFLDQYGAGQISIATPGSGIETMSWTAAKLVGQNGFWISILGKRVYADDVTLFHYF